MSSISMRSFERWSYAILFIVMFFGVFAMMSFARPASAAVCSFQSVGTNDFNTAGNWNCGQVPTGADDVLVGAGTTTNLSANATVQNISVSGTLNAVGSLLNVTSTATVLSGGVVTSTSGNLSFQTATSTGSIGTVTGSFSVTTTFQNNGTFNVAGGNATTTGALTNASGATINAGSGVLTFIGDFVNAGTFNSQTGRVRVAGGVDQAIAGTLFNNFQSTKTGGVATFSASSTIAGTLAADGSGGTVSGGSSSLTVVSAATILPGATVTSTSGTLTFNATVSSTGSLGSSSGNQLYASTLQNNGTFQVGSGTATTTGALTNATGATINGNGGTLSIPAAWTNNGTFNGQRGTVRFLGGSAQTIPAVAFYNLSVRTTGGDATLAGSTTANGTTEVVASVTLVVGANTFTAVGTITNLGTITVAAGGKIVHVAESHAFTDADGGAVTTYSQGSRAYITLQDSNRNLLGGTVETVTATITIAGNATESESVTLTETTASSGIFRNSAPGPIIVSASAPVSANNGSLEGSGTGNLSTTYTDNQDLTDSNTATKAFSVATGSGAGGTDTGGGGATISSSAGVIASPITTPAAPILSVGTNVLVKLPNDGNAATQHDSTVYYYGTDGKRHAFPNEKTYFTWYTDFSGVRVISASEMSSVPLGKNVTYRPGVRMVKFTTDPKVYAVDAGGLLRWIKTEALATALYGSNWNMKIDDISDAFYTSYRFGADISAASDFSPSAVTAAATTISADMGF